MIKNNSGDFSIVASKGLPRKIIDQTNISSGQGISGMAIEEKKAIFMKKVGESAENKGEYKTDNFILYPIIINEEVKAVINLTDRIGERNFSEKDIEAIKPIIDRISFVLEEYLKKN